MAVFAGAVSHRATTEEPDMKSVTLGALNGLLESIDPFASYLSAEQYKDYLKNKDSHKPDVGLVLSKRFGVGIVARSLTTGGESGLTRAT
jgi:carboxyl-terminal processing protease